MYVYTVIIIIIIIIVIIIVVVASSWRRRRGVLPTEIPTDEAHLVRIQSMSIQKRLVQVHNPDEQLMLLQMTQIAGHGHGLFEVVFW